MHSFRLQVKALAGTLLLASMLPAQAAIRVTEVAPWASGNTTYEADWFELTNTGASAVDITGWKIDDSSASFAAAVALRGGVSSIAAGQSVVFLNGNSTGTNDGTINAGFRTAWFGATPPAGLVIVNYGGSGIGLSTDGDAVNVYDKNGALQASVSFGLSPSGLVFPSFDNAAGVDGSVISQLSVAGVNGAFLSADGTQIGSPGSIAAVPEPATYALMLAGLGLVGWSARRRTTA